MKKLTQKNLDVYIFIKEFEEENKYCPSYKEMLENCNYKNIGSIKQTVEKLEEMKMIKTVRNEKGEMLARSITVVDDDYTKQIIKELREKFN